MEIDSTLLNSARMMDQEALVKIFDLYSSALYKYALHLCSDPLMADHIVGDVFAKFLDQMSAGNGPEANLRAYLYASTYHRVIDEARYSRRRVALEVTDWLPQDANSMFIQMEDQVMFQQILHTIQYELSDDQRHVIILRFLEELNVRETAAVLDKKEDHVRVIQNRAIAKLRRSLVPAGMQKVRSSSRIRSVSKGLGTV
jgi:RNA polymerase sigma-70 factor, ECF subfamily